MSRSKAKSSKTTKRNNVAKLGSRIKRVLHPEKETEPKVGLTFDLLLVIFFGAWALIPVYFWLFDRSDPNLADACGGPGWADFGCAGGTDSVIMTVINVIVWFVVLAIFLVALARITNRWDNFREVKKRKAAK